MLISAASFFCPIPTVSIGLLMKQEPGNQQESHQFTPINHNWHSLLPITFHSGIITKVSHIGADALCAY